MVLAQRDEKPPMAGHLDAATIRVRFEDGSFEERLVLGLLPGEARTLAAQLVAMADMLDMPDYSCRGQR